MRILLLNSYAERVGGAETYLYAMADALRARGHQVALFATSAASTSDEDELRVLRRSAYDPRRLVADPPLLEAFQAFLERFRPERIHAHNLHAFGLDFLRALATCGVPVAHTVHDFRALCPNAWCVRGDGEPCPGGAGAQCFEHDCQRNDLYDGQDVLLTHLRAQLLRKLAGASIAPSRELARTLERNGFEHVVHLPYFAVPGAREAIEREPTNRLLFLGRVNPEKGLATLIEAMPAVLEQRPDLRLDIVGDGPERERLARRAGELGVDQAVEFRPAVPHAEVEELFARAHALVLPSVWMENSPLTLYEAAERGLPVVGSRIGGIPDLVLHEQTGFLATPGDAADLARQILRCADLQGPDYAAFVARARESAERFDVDEHTRKLEELYASLDAPETNALQFAVDDDLLAGLAHTSAELADARHALEHGPIGWVRGVARRLKLPRWKR